MEHKKVDLKMDDGNRYKYFQEDTNGRFPEPLFDELHLIIVSNADHGHDKVTWRYIIGLIYVVGSTPTP